MFVFINSDCTVLLLRVASCIVALRTSSVYHYHNDYCEAGAPSVALLSSTCINCLFCVRYHDEVSAALTQAHQQNRASRLDRKAC